MSADLPAEYTYCNNAQCPRADACLRYVERRTDAQPWRTWHRFEPQLREEDGGRMAFVKCEGWFGW